MFLLVRDVSEYTEWNPILLGIFADEATAEAARLAYIADTTGNDPWQEQAYKVPDLARDVRVAKIENEQASHEMASVFLVTRHLEGMGQFSRWYLAVFASLDAARERAAQEDAEEKVVAEYISIEEFTVNKHYFRGSDLPFEEWSPGLWEPGEP